ncbi:MAG: transketolase [Gemmatimonadota bacterium]
MAPSAHPALDTMPIEDLCIHTIRTLAMDAVERAGSGHPGTAMALAPLAYTLWTRHLRFNPGDPAWFDRDRFVLSAGHAAILQYALLHLTGYDLPLEELERLRKWGSRTPGHPEHGLTPGVETTTGPLGQGIMTSVGMAIAEAHLAAIFNTPEHPIVDHRTYAICGDGDLMEGASHEAASLAGHLGLGKLTWIYDDNHITIDGDTALAYSDDVRGRFQAYGWHVQDVGDRANDVETLDRALRAAREVADRPSLIIVRSHIAFGSPHKQDTPEAHGAPLGAEEIRLTKRAYEWPEDSAFLVPERVRRHMEEPGRRGAERQARWNDRLAAYRVAHPELAARFHARLAGKLPEGWDSELPRFAPGDGPMATRAASGKVLNAIAPRVPWLVGGSADLTDSNKSRIAGSGNLNREDFSQRNLHWGIREHVMCAAASGLALHGGIRPFAATFFVFTDYARPAIRLAALMELPVIYVLTHDSIGLGGDGPTHQPVEHLAAFRAMPHMRVIRPADANEVVEAWRVAMERADGPSMLILSRQKLPIFDRGRLAGAEGARRGAYVLSPEHGARADVLLIGSGSEVELLLEAQRRLAAESLDARVVSMPCWEIFREQSEEYRAGVLPPDVTARVAVEAAAALGWREWVGDRGAVIGVNQFGASADYRDTYRQFGLTPEAVVETARRLTALSPDGAA